MELEVYLVGGAVRDELLGLKPTEKDYVVIGATPEDMLAQGFKPVGKDFPIFLHPVTKEEYALARTERKVAPGYHGFEFRTDPSITLAEDLARRDLTINAIALSADGLSIIDPYNGVADIENRILRHVSDAFVEDPIRVLRLARFAARFKKMGFQIAPETLELANTLRRAGELNALVPERVWKETWKALAENNPEEYFHVLRSCGGLSILFPELEALFGIPSVIQEKHFMDSGMHALLSLSNAARLSPLPETRFAALMHSVGKGKILPQKWPVLENYQDYSEDILLSLAEKYKIPKHVKEIAKIVASHHQLWLTANTAESLLHFFEITDALRRTERFSNIVRACEACFITHKDKQHSEFLIEVLLKLQKQLKALKPTLINVGQPLKAVYQQAKLRSLNKILQEQKIIAH